MQRLHVSPGVRERGRYGEGESDAATAEREG